MALNKHLISTSFYGVSYMSVANEQTRLCRRFLVHRDVDFQVRFSNAVRLKCCLEHRHGVLRKGKGEIQKAHAMAPDQGLTHRWDVALSDDLRLKLADEGRSCHNGGALGSLGQVVPEKLVVAVDVDEVLGSFLPALNKFIADCYSSNHSVSEYYVYEFCKIWKCSPAEANARVHEFFKTPYFSMGIHPIPGALHALYKLSNFCNLSVVTSRQNVIKDHTLKWIEEHFPGLFQEIHFGNHFALDGKSRSKSEICRSLGAQILIDDNPKYALECAEAGIRVLLFDYRNSYPWSKSEAAASHPLVTTVHNWQEVEEQLLSWCCLRASPNLC